MPKPNEYPEKKWTNVGSLWRTKQNSVVVASGKLQMDGRDGPQLDIVLVKNDKEGNEKRPDFRIVLVTPKDDEKPAPTSKPPKGKGKPNAQDDDTPF